MGAGASSILGLLRLLPHGRGGLLLFGITKATAAWASGRPPL